MQNIIKEMVMSKSKLILKLFLTFFKIGAFTFGGGYAMIPLIEKETVEKNNWIESEEILEVFAVSESTPGPIAINTATFIGYKIAGVFGAMAATLGVVLPSFVIILSISFLLKEFAHLKPVVYAFNGIRAGVLALIVKAFWSMYKSCPKNIFSYIIAAAIFVLAGFLKINALYCLLGAAVLGIVYTLLLRRKVK